MFSYEPTSNMMISARNYDGREIALAYEGINAYDSAAIDNYAAQVRRVISMELLNDPQVDPQDVAHGTKTLFDYRHMNTKVTSVTNAASDAGKTLTYQFNNNGNVICAYDELGFACSGTYSASTANQQTGASRLKKVVVNLMTNVDFSANWSAVIGANGDSVTRDTTVRCLSVPSTRITKSDGAETSETYYRQTVNILAAGKHTFSAYVKNTEAITQGGLFIRMRSGNDVSYLANREAVARVGGRRFVNRTPTNIVYESRHITGLTSDYNSDSAASGWDRVYVSAELPVGEATLELVSAVPSGSAWFACPQLEQGAIANHVNLLLNGDFTRTYANGARTFAADWSASGGISANALNGVVQHIDADMPSGLSGNALRIHCYCNTDNSSFYQTISASGAQGDVFVVGGWLNATSIAAGIGSFKPCILTRFLGTDNAWSDYQHNEYDTQRVGWKYAEWAIAAPKAYKELQIHVQYARNTGTAMFGNVFVHREEFGQSFAYDDDDNLVSVASLSAKKSSIEYDDADNVTSYRQPGAAETSEYKANYGDTAAQRKKHLPLTTTTPIGVKQTNTYDEYGNCVSVENRKANGTVFMRSETTYSNGNYVATQTDARGNAVVKTTDAVSGLVQSVADPSGQTVSYAYDASKRVTGVESVCGRSR